MHNKKPTPDFDVITLEKAERESSYDFVPHSFDEYIGQSEIKKKLEVYVQAARMRNEALDHLLLFGPPGLGKTTLAQIMAHLMDAKITICSGPMLERTGDAVALLSKLEKKDILFIDEIHRVPTAVEEIFYSAMDHFRVDVILGHGIGAKTMNLPIAPFTLIGATTKSGMISAPLRSRFGIIERIDFYTPEDLAKIVQQNAHFLQSTISSESALRIARCSRGTPRIAKKILRRVRDFAQVHNDGRITSEIVISALAFLGLDEDGLSTVDNMLLRKIIEQFQGGPVGLETLSSLIGEDAETIESVYEPFLLRMGYLEKTPRGRQIPRAILSMLMKKYFGQSHIE